MHAQNPAALEKAPRRWSASAPASPNAPRFLRREKADRAEIAQRPGLAFVDTSRPSPGPRPRSRATRGAVASSSTASIVGRLAEKMHRHDRLRPRRDAPGGIAHVEIESDRAANRRRPASRRRRATQPAVAKKVKLGQSTSSPGPMPSAISARRIASVPELTPSANRAPVNSASALLEFFHFRPEDEMAGAQHAQKSLAQFRLKRAVLRLEIEQGNLHFKRLNRPSPREPAVRAPRRCCCRTRPARARAEHRPPPRSIAGGRSGPGPHAAPGRE